MRGLKLAHDAAELVAWVEGATEGVAEAHEYAQALEAAEAESRARASAIVSAMERCAAPPTRTSRPHAHHGPSSLLHVLLSCTPSRTSPCVVSAWAMPAEVRRA
jgi:hypothetical protein